jgi:hypothetical protein
MKSALVMAKDYLAKAKDKRQADAVKQGWANAAADLDLRGFLSGKYWTKEEEESISRLAKELK